MAPKSLVTSIAQMQPQFNHKNNRRELRIDRTQLAKWRVALQLRRGIVQGAAVLRHGRKHELTVFLQLRRGKNLFVGEKFCKRRGSEPVRGGKNSALFSG